MPITITTLNNNSAVAKTFTEISKDRTSAEYLNTTDTSSVFDSRIVIKQQEIGKSKGIPIRRALVQVTAKAPDVQNGSLAAPETITVNFTLTGPAFMNNLDGAKRRDAVSYLINLLTNDVIDRLARGEV